MEGFFFAVGVPCFFSLVFSFLGFCPRVLSALRPSLVRPFEFTCDCLRVCGSCCADWWSVLLAYGMLWQSFFWEGKYLPPVHGVIGALPRPYGGLPIEGSRRSAVISLCRPLWRPLAAAVEGADSFTSRSVCLRRGEHPSEARRSRSVNWLSYPG